MKAKFMIMVFLFFLL